MKQVSHKVVDNGGIIRSIQNHGLRKFPHRFQAKYPDYLTQQRYYEKGRFISIYYDANPTTLQYVENILSMNDQVLRVTHLKCRSKLDYITMEREDKNPYIQRIVKEDTRIHEQRKAEDLAIETATTSTDNLIDNVIDGMKDD